MQIESNNGSYADADVQAIAVAVFKDEKADDDGFLKDLDALTGGVIKSVIDSEELKGKDGETVYLHLVGKSGLKAQRVLLIGVGDQSDFGIPQISQFAGIAARTLRNKSVKSVALVPRIDGNAEDVAAALIEGAVLGSFEPDK